MRGEDHSFILLLHTPHLCPRSSARPGRTASLLQRPQSSGKRSPTDSCRLALLLHLRRLPEVVDLEGGYCCDAECNFGCMQDARELRWKSMEGVVECVSCIGIVDWRFLRSTICARVASAVSWKYLRSVLAASVDGRKFSFSRSFVDAVVVVVASSGRKSYC
ncbi:hypothetical protein BDW22DRAFT_1101391 [Trametopsis cervina]|nr:hypothetical protein BDW22DRAFT_1101391 [Trametopsis cervina]